MRAKSLILFIFCQFFVFGHNAHADNDGMQLLEHQFEQVVRGVQYVALEEPAIMVMHGYMPFVESQKLSLLRVRENTLVETLQMTLDRSFRWVEFIDIHRGVARWLVLKDDTLWVAELDENAQQFNLLRSCSCETAFAGGTTFLPSKLRLVASTAEGSINGGDEPIIFIHGSDALQLFKLNDFNMFVPIAQYLWYSGDGVGVSDWGGLTARRSYPSFLWKDINADGLPDLIQPGSYSLNVTYNHLTKANPSYFEYVLSKNNIARLVENGVPSEWIAALSKNMGFQSTADMREVLESLDSFSPELWEEHNHLEDLYNTEDLLVPTHVSIGDYAAPDANEHRTIRSIVNINDDRINDILLLRTVNRNSLFKQKNYVSLHYGLDENAQYSLTVTPQLLFSEGPAFIESIYPLVNNNNEAWVLVATTSINLFSIIRALTMDTISMDASLYRWEDTELKNFSTESLTLEIENDNRKNRPILISPDINGDGWRDLAINQYINTISIYKNSADGPDWDDPIAEEFPVPMPYRGNNVIVGKLSSSARESIIFWYPDSRNTAQRMSSIVVVSLDE